MIKVGNDINESLDDLGLSGVKSKEDALKFIKVAYPGKSGDANRWLFYNKCLIRLITKFNLTENEVNSAIK